MDSNDFERLTGDELLRRIYAAQLRIMMDVEKIHSNVVAIREKVDAGAFDMEQINESGDNPVGFKHLFEIHRIFERAFDDFPKQLDSPENHLNN
jgi:hypothetical protein